MNAAIVQNPVQASVRNIVMRPAQSTVVVGPAAANAVQPSVSVVGGRVIALTSTAAANVPRPVMPANASVAGMLLQRHGYLVSLPLKVNRCSSVSMGIYHKDTVTLTM